MEGCGVIAATSNDCDEVPGSGAGSSAAPLLEEAAPQLTGQMCLSPAGFLLFLRGFINYAKVRKMPDTFSTLPRTRVLFIY